MVPSIGGRRNRASGSLEDGEDMPFERSSVLAPFHSGPQLLGNDGAEMLEWRERPMEALECFVGGTIAKGVNEELRVEDVPARHASHGSTSGDVISMPSIARVPLTSLRWNTARSSARSIVSVAVAAPSASCAALNFDNGRRYV